MGDDFLAPSWGLLLFRHGPAGDRQEWRAAGHADADRPLTRDGRARTRAAVRGLAGVVGRPGAVGTSPLVRAVETAAILCRGLDADPAEEVEALSPEAPPEAILPWLHARRRAGLVALVGHEPYLSRLACFLTAGPGKPFLSLRKAGGCLLEVDGRPRPRAARLEWLLAPAQLRRLGR
jgi:phosphohistidine phosphatase